MTSPVPIKQGQGSGRQGTPASATPTPPLPVEIQTQKLTEALDNFRTRAYEDLQTAWSTDHLAQLLPKILGESDWQLTAGFSETRVDLPDSPLDLSLVDGASLCLGIQARDHRVSVPHPVGLQGFTAGAWIFFQPLNGIVTDDAGRVGVTAPCFRGAVKDITEEILTSPLSALFSRKRVEPVSQDALIILIKKFLPGNSETSPSTGGPMAGIMDHLDRLILSGLIFRNAAESPENFLTATGALCHGGAASLQAEINIPLIKWNLQREAFKDFDFSGLQEFSLHWPDFPLKQWMAHSDFQINSGIIGVDAQVSPDQRSLRLELKFRELKIGHPGLWGGEDVRLNGKLSLTLHQGGQIHLNAKDFQVVWPMFPTLHYPLASVQASLHGDLYLKKQPDDSFQVLHSGLQLKEFSIKNIEEKSWKWPGLPGALQGNLHGALGLDFNPSHPYQQLTPSFKLAGQLQFIPEDTQKFQQVHFDNLHLAGKLSLGKNGEDWQPNLSASSLSLKSDLAIQRKGTEFLQGEGIYFNLEGGERKEFFGEVLERATLKTGAAGVHVGQFAWKPEVRLDLESWKADEGFLMEGSGHWDLDSLTPKVALSGDAKIVPPFTDLGSPITLSTDGKNLHWNLTMDRPQRVGPIEVDGKVKLSGLNGNMRLATLEPLTVSLHDNKLIKNLRIKGSRDEKKTYLKLQASSLAEMFRGSLGIQLLADGRLSGAYDFSPLPQVLPRGKDFALNSARVQGSFSTPPWEEMLVKPQIYLRGQGAAALNGIAQGNITTDYAATLIYQPTVERQTPRGPREFPANFQLIFSRRRPSRIELGPFLDPQGQERIRGSALIKGTLILTPLKNQVIIGGSRLGLHHGTFYWEGHPEPALSQLTLDAEQLWGIQRGVAIGRNLRIETNLNLEPFLKEKGEAVEENALQRHILYSVDRQPFTMAAFWRLLQNHLEPPGQKKGEKP